MNRLPTKLKVTNVKQYEATYILLLLLSKLGLTKTKESSLSLVYHFGDDFERCDCCEEAFIDCSCEREPRYLSSYDDEASFE